MAQHLSGPAKLDGQVALITGGAGGMGRAITKTFSEAGAIVVATDIAEQEDLGKAEKQRYLGAYEDLTDRELGRAVKAKYQPLFDDFADVPAPSLRAVKGRARRGPS